MISNKDNVLRMSKTNNQDVMTVIPNIEVCPESKGEEGILVNKMINMTAMGEARTDNTELGVDTEVVLHRKVTKKKLR
jgi:hypothetical protein